MFRTLERYYQMGQSTSCLCYERGTRVYSEAVIAEMYRALNGVTADEAMAFAVGYADGADEVNGFIE